jgi:hypothetical protein
VNTIFVNGSTLSGHRRRGAVLESGVDLHGSILYPDIRSPGADVADPILRW